MHSVLYTILYYTEVCSTVFGQWSLNLDLGVGVGYQCAGCRTGHVARHLAASRRENTPPAPESSSCLGRWAGQHAGRTGSKPLWSHKLGEWLALPRADWLQDCQWAQGCLRNMLNKSISQDTEPLRGAYDKEKGEYGVVHPSSCPNTDKKYVI